MARSNRRIKIHPIRNNEPRRNGSANTRSRRRGALKRVYPRLSPPPPAIYINAPSNASTHDHINPKREVMDDVQRIDWDISWLVVVVLAAVRTVCITARWETTSFSRCPRSDWTARESPIFRNNKIVPAFPEQLHSHYGAGNDLSFSSLLILTV